MRKRNTISLHALTELMSIVTMLFIGSCKEDEPAPPSSIGSLSEYNNSGDVQWVRKAGDVRVTTLHCLPFSTVRIATVSGNQ